MYVYIYIHTQTCKYICYLDLLLVHTGIGITSYSWDFWEWDKHCRAGLCRAPGLRSHYCPAPVACRIHMVLPGKCLSQPLGCVWQSVCLCAFIHLPASWTILLPSYCLGCSVPSLSCLQRACCWLHLFCHRDAAGAPAVLVFRSCECLLVVCNST